MSLVPRFFSRSRFGQDDWAWNSLDLFDPFDELDRRHSRNMFWVTRPSFFEPLTTTSMFPALTAPTFPSLLAPIAPRVPEKYRISVDCAGYSPRSLSVEYKKGKLNVTGREEVKTNENDYSIKEFKKSYQLPDNAITEDIASFHANGQLVVEVPLKSNDSSQIGNEDLFPRVIERGDGTKQIELSCALPRGIDASKVSVTCKDRDLVIKAEDNIEKSDSISSSYYYKRCTLPENTDLNGIKCNIENNRLKIDAPIKQALTEVRYIPVQHK